MQHSDLCVGIDLGTTNSVIATCGMLGNKLTIQTHSIDRFVNNGLKEHRELLPSCVYYEPERTGSMKR